MKKALKSVLPICMAVAILFGTAFGGARLGRYAAPQCDEDPIYVLQ